MKYGMFWKGQYDHDFILCTHSLAEKQMENVVIEGGSCRAKLISISICCWAVKINNQFSLILYKWGASRRNRSYALYCCHPNWHHPARPSFGMTLTLELYSCFLHRLHFIDAVIPEEELSQFFFWYDNGKGLKICFAWCYSGVKQHITLVDRLLFVGASHFRQSVFHKIGDLLSLNEVYAKGFIRCIKRTVHTQRGSILVDAFTCIYQ